MATMLLASPVLSDSGTISTVGSEAAALPAYHLQRMQPSEVWRATSTANAYFTIDLGPNPSTYNLFSLLHTNANSTTQWRIRAGDTEAAVNGTPDEDTGTMDAWAGDETADLADWTTTPMLYFLTGGTTWNYRWIRIDVSSISMDYFEAGRLFIAKAWQPDTNLLYGAQFPSWHEEVRRTYSHSGAIYPSIRARYPMTSFTVRSTRADILGNAQELGLTRGVSEDVLFVFDPDDSAYTAHGMVHGLLEQSAPVMIPARNIYEITYTIRGLI